MNHATLVALGALVLVSQIPAQTTVVAPNGHAMAEGNSNNTIPWWSTSATYQQIHDVSDMANVLGSPAAILKGLRFRKDAGVLGSTLARTMDVEIRLGMTATTAATASSTFAANLGPSPIVVLPYNNISFPALTQVSTPNPMVVTLPFTTLFPYVAVGNNNLCYELRIRNSTSSATVACDASQWVANIDPLLGSGCLVPGYAQPATIGLRSLAWANGAYRNVLANATANAACVFFIGFVPSQLTLPGLCAPLETPPIVDVPGAVGASGGWDLTLTFGNLGAINALTIYGQFVFVEPSLPHGLGLSTCSSITLPAQSHAQIARIWASPFGGGAGYETATSGSVGMAYGLVTGFDI